MPRLIVLAGPDTGKEFVLPPGPASLGRAGENTVVLTDPQVSRRHFDLVAGDGHLDLTDRGSGNGTLVNGVRAATATVRPGDRIAVGDSVLLFTVTGAAPPGVVRTVPEDAGSVLLAKPDAADTDWLRTRLAHLGVLYEASAAVGDILDVDQLLTKLLGLAVRTTGADAGLVVLADEETGVWMPRVTRAGTGHATAFSRTVVDYVRTNRVGVLAADAAADDRFAGGDSVVRQGIREVIAVPMKGRRGTVGALVVETVSVAAGGATRFTPDHLTLASALAHHAALAVEEARYFRATANAEKLAAVGTAVAHLSHHIKNIMHGVRFGGDLVSRGLAADDRGLIATGWALVERNQARIDDLIHDMLSYGKDREPVREPTDLAKIVADVLDVVRGRAGDRGVTLTANGGPVPVVTADGEGLFRALLNVVTNAVDAVSDLPTPTVTVTLAGDGRAVTVTVVDSGPGVPDDQRDEIFKPFVSTKGSRGTGLGLPVSRKIMREHGGDLTAEAGPGGRFVFTLPLPS
jgi:signal transduction histidine kinase